MASTGRAAGAAAGGAAVLGVGTACGVLAGWSALMVAAYAKERARARRLKAAARGGGSQAESKETAAPDRSLVRTPSPLAQHPPDPERWSLPLRSWCNLSIWHSARELDELTAGSGRWLTARGGWTGLQALRERRRWVDHPFCGWICENGAVALMAVVSLRIRGNLNHRRAALLRPRPNIPRPVWHWPHVTRLLSLSVFFLLGLKAIVVGLDVSPARRGRGGRRRLPGC